MIRGYSAVPGFEGATEGSTFGSIIDSGIKFGKSIVNGIYEAGSSIFGGGTAEASGVGKVPENAHKLSDAVANRNSSGDSIFGFGF